MLKKKKKEKKDNRVREVKPTLLSILCQVDIECSICMMSYLLSFGEKCTTTATRTETMSHCVYCLVLENWCHVTSLYNTIANQTQCHTDQLPVDSFSRAIHPRQLSAQSLAWIRTVGGATLVICCQRSMLRCNHVFFF